MTRDNHSEDMDAQREELLDRILKRPRRSAAEKLRWLEEIKKRAAAQDPQPPAPAPSCAPAQRQDLSSADLVSLGNTLDAQAWEQFFTKSAPQAFWDAISAATTARADAENYATAVRRDADAHARKARREAEAYADTVRREAEEQAAATIARAAAYEDQALENAARTQQRARREADDVLSTARAEADSIMAFARHIQASWLPTPTDETSRSAPVRAVSAASKLLLVVDDFAACGVAGAFADYEDVLASAAAKLSNLAEGISWVWGSKLPSATDDGCDVAPGYSGSYVIQAKRWREVIDGAVDEAAHRPDLEDAIRSHCGLLLMWRAGGDVVAPIAVPVQGSSTRIKTIRPLEEIIRAELPCVAASDPHPTTVLEGEVVDHEVEGAASR